MFFISELYNRTESTVQKIPTNGGGAGDTSKDDVFIHIDLEKLENWTSMYMNLYNRIHCCT